MKLSQVVFLIGLFAAAACQSASAQKLYDATADQTMQDVLKKFDDMTSKDANVFQLAIANVAVVQQNDLEILRQKNLGTLNQTLVNLPTSTWEELTKTIRDTRYRIINYYASSDGNTTNTNPPTAAQEAAANKKLEDLKTTISDLTDAKTKLQANLAKAAPTVQQIEDVVTSAEALDKPAADVAAEVNALATNIPDALAKLKALSATAIEPSHGLQPLIIQFRLDRAKLELERLQLTEQHDKERAQLLQGQMDILTKVLGDPPATAQAFCGANDKNIGTDFVKLLSVCPNDMAVCSKPLPGCPNGLSVCSTHPSECSADLAVCPNYQLLCPTDHPTRWCAAYRAKKKWSAEELALRNAYGARQPERIISTILEVSQASHELNDDGVNAYGCLVDMLQMLSTVSSIVGNQMYQIERGDMAQYYDETVFQLQLAELDAREHSTLLRTSIQGLATYEQGGIKPQDIANLISAAEVAATAVIAAGVK